MVESKQVEYKSEAQQGKPLTRSVNPEALQLIPEAMARKYTALPLDKIGNVLQVAMANPADLLALEAIEAQTQMRVEPKAFSADEILESIDLNYRSYEEIEQQISSISLESETAEAPVKLDTVTDAPIAKALSLVMEGAVKARASDIHIQPQEDRLRVRYRIDGTLQDMLSLPLKTSTPLISRIKVLAKMNIADHHRPQDGQLTIKMKGHQPIDVRVATIATVYGEMATLRLLDKSRAVMALSKLGYLPETLTTYEEMLRVPHGMILVSGPTGAGKTTTLYASINSLDSMGRNIITVEDPVEYRFNNINQIQVNPRAGLTFASGLRSILRQDPDVILVGEIRDNETAGIAIQSALTGHLVLSSIHANDAVGVVLRLQDLGVEPFLVSSALIGVIAQGMVRRIHHECAEITEVPALEQMAYAKQMGEERKQFPMGRGCKLCSFTGYLGRTGIFEILKMSDEIRTMLINGATAAQVRNQAIKEGMIPLIKDGMKKVKANITTPAEVLRNAYSVD